MIRIRWRPPQEQQFVPSPITPHEVRVGRCFPHSSVLLFALRIPFIQKSAMLKPVFRRIMLDIRSLDGMGHP